MRPIWFVYLEAEVDVTPPNDDVETWDELDEADESECVEFSAVGEEVTGLGVIV